MRLIIKILAACLIWASVDCRSKEENGEVFFVQQSSSGDLEALLVIEWIEYNNDMYGQCEYYTDSDEIDKRLKSASDSNTQAVSETDMQNMVDDCSEQGMFQTSQRRRREIKRAIEDNNNEGNAVSSDNGRAPGRSTESNTNEESTTLGYDGWPVIFPGTKWCGAGDKAKSYDDLGLHQDTDRCCRAHDLCNDTLAPGETRNNLTNSGPFTALSCTCDHDFYNCLSRVNSVTSNTIGNMYFNILKRDCYEEDYPPSDKCKKYFTLLKLKCKEYEKDTSKGKIYQWVKARRYKKIPFPGPLTVELP